MKKVIKSLSILILSILLFGCFVGCTYKKDGSVCQDLSFSFKYTDANNEEKTIDSKITVYITFAEQNAKRLVQLVKDDYYSNTVAVFDYNLNYLEVGTYEYVSDEYSVKKSDYSTVKGEFVNAGQSSRLSVEAGSIIMMRVPDAIECAGQKYDTAKTTFVIMLSSDATISKNDYTVVGKIDADALKELQEMRDALKADSDGYSTVLVRTRDENGQVNGYDGETYSDAVYTVKESVVYYGDKSEIEKDDEGDLEDTKVTDANRFNKVVLPTKLITVSTKK